MEGEYPALVRARNIPSCVDIDVPSYGIDIQRGLRQSGATASCSLDRVKEPARTSTFGGSQYLAEGL